MQKKFLLILFIFYSQSSSLELNFETIKLYDFTKIGFTLRNEFVVLEYNNLYTKNFENYAINFIFEYGKKSSTKVYYYDSLSKIERGNDGFINYLNMTSLKETQYLRIFPYDKFYKDKTTYYIVLFDISTVYTDYIYTINSINYLPLKNSISYKNTLNIQLNFNLIIQENVAKYLHYQSSQPKQAILAVPTSYFIIKSEKDEVFIDRECYGVSGFVKIEPNVKYYIQVILNSNKNYNEPQLLLNFQNYRANFLLDDIEGEEIQILYPQYISFFKNISNLAVDEQMSFRFKISESLYHNDYFYFKFYESDNFQELEKTFPTEREDYDMKVYELKEGGYAIINLKKTFNSIKGVLIGVYIDRNYELSGMMPTSIIVSIYNQSKEKKESHENIGNTIIIVLLCLIILIAVIIALRKKCKKNVTPPPSYNSDEYALAIIKL